MSLSYGITFLCNCCRKLIIHWKVLYDIFLLKTCKVVLIYTTYENSDLVKVVIDDNAIHGMTYGVISEDNLTFYYKGTEEFFSALNNAISEKKF